MSSLRSGDANVTRRLSGWAASRADACAVLTPAEKFAAGQYLPRATGGDRRYHSLSFAELDARVDSLAAGLQKSGVACGERVAVLVPFGVEFIVATLACLRTRAQIVLIDPGMPRRHLVDCLAESRPRTVIATTRIQWLVRTVFRQRFRDARRFITLGRPRPGGLSYRSLASTDAKQFQPPHTASDDPAAVVFTTGSTGVPKGVEYTHKTFNTQVEWIADYFGIEPGGKNLACFPLFGLFDPMLGSTSIIADMDMTRPASVDPPRLLDAIDQWQIDRCFGSPALWRRVVDYTSANPRTCSSLQLALSAGAPVAPDIVARARQVMHPDGRFYTPYGATECLPVAAIESREIARVANLSTFATCVGTRFNGIDWKVIAITDESIARLTDVRELPVGEIGELIVAGDVVSARYVTRTEQNALHKIDDDGRVWHRIGDVGYIDEQNRFWFCGRKSHRVRLDAETTLFTELIENRVNRLAGVRRSALVGILRAGSLYQRAVIICETNDEFESAGGEEAVRSAIAADPALVRIDRVFFWHRPLPTDIRHNAKIFREQLAQWVIEHG